MPEPATVVVEPTKVVEPVAATVITEPVKPVEPVKAVVEPATPVVPEKYSVKLAEKTQLTEKDLEPIYAQAKEKGLTNDQLQLLVDQREKGVAEYQAREVERIKAEAPKWLEQLKADKEIGGEKLNESIENAKRVINKYADQEFKDFLNTSGLGNHPLVVRQFAKIGKAFGEAHWIEGSPVSVKKETSPAEKLYDKTPK